MYMSQPENSKSKILILQKVNPARVKNLLCFVELPDKTFFHVYCNMDRDISWYGFWSRYAALPFCSISYVSWDDSKFKKMLKIWPFYTSHSDMSGHTRLPEPAKFHEIVTIGFSVIVLTSG